MKKRIMLDFMLIITLCVVAMTVLFAAVTYNLFAQRVSETLSANASVLASLLESGADQETTLAPLAGELRVTLVAPDGAVTYDNEADAAAMSNHADRTEIAQAMKTGHGEAVRNSQTSGRSTFYYAVRMGNGGVLRVAKEAGNVFSLYVNAVPLVLLVLAGMLALSFVLANVLTRRLLQPIGQMTAHLGNVSGVARYPELEPFMDMIQSQHEEILKSANMRVEFTANVSHELKTPLTSISGYAELIESGMATGEQVGHFAGEIHKSANRLLTLINDIIRLSQMDSPAQELSLEPVDLSAVAETTVEQLRMSATKMNVTLALDAHPAWVNADRQMMEELLYNLCDNAIRYNVRGGSVRVEVRPVREQVIVCVQDTGIGISKENQEHVFERFYRVDKSRSKATGGTGLGLAIVKHIAAKHGAQISMDSELGRGTSISVTFERLNRG